MSLRFRRSVRLFPGVRLNFSRGGISTTIGVRGATMTMGPRGTYANVGLPGSGLSYRTKLSSPKPRQPGPAVQPGSPPAEIIEPRPHFSDPNAQEIHSADISVLTSEGLNELKRLINEAAVKRRSLVQEVGAGERALKNAKSRLRHARMFVIRIFTAGAIPGLVEKCEATAGQLGEARASLAGCFVEVDFGLTDATLASYAALVRTFDELGRSEQIWDVTAVRTTDRVVERTTATQSVARVPVKFDCAKSTIVKTDHQALRMQNASGNAIQIFPGFVMMTEPSGDFALLEFAEVDLNFSATRFIEEGKVPSDSEVIGQTWKKANKDGSPDRRFKDNYRIPIVRYGEMLMRSPTGLLEGYEFSNYAASEAFAAAFAKHKIALASSETPEPAANDDKVTDFDQQDAMDAMDAVGAASFAEAAPPSLIFDWITLMLIVVAIAVAGVWIYRKLAVGA